MDRTKAVAWAIVVTAAVAILELLRFALFAAMLILNRVVEPVLSFMAGAGLFLVLTGWIFGPGHREPVIGGAVMAVGSMVLLIGWNTVLQALAPEGTVIINKY
jgi:hypothetical protein